MERAIAVVGPKISYLVLVGPITEPSGGSSGPTQNLVLHFFQPTETLAQSYEYGGMTHEQAQQQAFAESQENVSKVLGLLW